mgnify:CR=1 FL=1
MRLTITNVNTGFHCSHDGLSQREVNAAITLLSQAKRPEDQIVATVDDSAIPIPLMPRGSFLIGHPDKDF